ncbi:hypothetical protein LTR20_004926 [Exophiala xenobiotica]|nr:hypothetical protein LTS13_001015 [Exophiala xenobiotica]KAK5398168.1 hypothetical protein LTR79_004450 [Exophiala xenobiotica]KAK5417763.1 hypothetical protein LTR90_004937 [Exophiala xenobiotica]KAK5464220.1 hypothetical protein LTR20_004926 [Exophiala xenobiotica]KAK5497980.1 hypothetical protein LTR26_001380 [Exophiala xenobiotica]
MADELPAADEASLVATGKKRIPVSTRPYGSGTRLVVNGRSLAESVRRLPWFQAPVRWTKTLFSVRKTYFYSILLKIESLETEVQLLKNRLDNQQHEGQVATEHSTAPVMTTSPSSIQGLTTLPHAQSPAMQRPPSSPSRKRARTQVEVEVGSVPNFVARGIVTIEQAELFFGAFFQGCDRYVPVFDPHHDSFQSISTRSSLLFDAILAIGSGVLGDDSSQVSNMLNFQLKKMINLAIVRPEYACLETVQALLIIACYSAERSLILAFATRMAVDIGLPDAYEELTKRLVDGGTAGVQGDSTLTEAELMRRARAWFQLMVLEQILRVDAGNLRAFQLRGKARRCRILLNQPFSTILDLRLLSQVELNALREKIHDSLSTCDKDDGEEVMAIVRDAQIDLDIWYDDWQSIMKRSSTAETPVLLLNLEVQKYWSQAVILCRAVRALGNENISEMSVSQRHLLTMAKMALKRHLRIILDQPQYYLAHFRYAMDFVWAKAAFCFLLLLKLTRLLPEEDATFNQRLLRDGYVLLSELDKAGGRSSNGGGRSQTSKMYLQVLQVSIQKYARAVQGDRMDQQSLLVDGPDIIQDMQSPLNFFWTSDNQSAQKELESFIPEQFVFEWDFPGLTLFSSPDVGENFLDEFLMGTNVDAESWFLGVPG